MNKKGNEKDRKNTRVREEEKNTRAREKKEKRKEPS
jgi:hypothetical protein